MMTATIVKNQFERFKDYVIEHNLPKASYSIQGDVVAADKVVIFYDKKIFASWCLYCSVLEKELKIRISANDNGTAVGDVARYH